MSTAGHDDDPISAASSGLLALGVTSRRRMETLGLLGALLDLADERGEILLDSALMETEERLGLDLCLEGYEWLEQLGVIRRTWSGWQIPNFSSHRGPAGATETALALLRRHVGADFDVVIPMPTREPTPVVAPLKPWRRRVPVMAAGVAAGIAALAGATQFVPQAAVSTRDAAIRTSGTARPVAGAGAPAATEATTAASTAATDAVGTAPSLDAVTTTTSTTLLPSVPCLNDAINTLTSRSGLGLNPKTSAPLPPDALPCP